MLKREEYLRYIADSFGILELAVTNRGLLRLLDLNVVAESFFMHVLNVIFRLNLQNLNDKGNMPGLDLGDESAKVAFQVSSQSSHAKLQKTIDKVIRWELYKKYPNIRVLVIGKKQTLYRKAFDTQGLFAFRPSKDVLDIRDLIKKLQHLNTPELGQLYGIIKRELAELGILSQLDQLEPDRAGYLAARQNAVAGYRNLLIRRGAVVDLNPLGIAVPPIELEEMDAGVQFYRPGND